MNKHEILDDNFFDKKQEPTLIDKIKTVSKWWFFKRLYYNGILILIQTFIFISLYNRIEARFGIMIGLEEALSFTIVANVLFTLGSIVSIVSVIFKKDSSENRELLWQVGAWFSVILTMYLYFSSLS